MGKENIDNRKPLGRKKLPEHLKRKNSTKIEFKCNELELKFINTKMSLLFPNYESDKAFYCRNYFLNSLKDATSSNKHILNPKNYEDKLTQRFVFDLNKIGTNLNQTVRNLNIKSDSIDSKTLYHLQNNITNLLNLKSEIIQILLDDS